MTEPNVSDSYYTVKEISPEILYKVKGSKFYARVYPFTLADDLKDLIATHSSRYAKAGHHCYAYRIGSQYRANDDGEPNHTAGDPILGQLDSFELDEVLVIVSRIFGGTKLGVSGLIKSYREAARLAIEESTIIKSIRTAQVWATCTYEHLSELNRFITSHQYSITDQVLTENCRLNIRVPASHKSSIRDRAKHLYNVSWD